MSDSERVIISINDGVADVRLNRPDKMNALDGPMFDALVDAGARLAADARVRAVVLSGEGRGFCAGLDVSSFAAMAGPGSDGDAGGSGNDPTQRGGLRRRLPGKPTNAFQQAAFTWAEMPVPVIAAVHGVALGGGIQLALAADIRVVAPDARLSVLEIRWGLVPDMTGTEMLRRVLPLDKAKELTWSGRMVSGEEAVAMGLATQVSEDPRKDALELAADIAGRNPQAIRAAKRLLDQAGSVGLEQQFISESEEMARLIGSPNQVEAVTSWFEKRPAVFADPDLTT